MISGRSRKRKPLGRAGGRFGIWDGWRRYDATRLAAERNLAPAEGRLAPQCSGSRQKCGYGLVIDRDVGKLAFFGNDRLEPLTQRIIRG